MGNPRIAVMSAATVGLLLLAACGSSSSNSAAGKPSALSPSSVPTTGATGSVAPVSPVTASSTTATSTAATSSAATSAAPSAAPSASATLPDGTTTILPGHRVVAYYGASVTPPDNALPDAGTPDQAAKAVEAHAKPFATPGDPVIGAFELISTIIQSSPGTDGSHASDLDLSTIQKYETSALKNHLLLILDIQPGTDHFLPHVKRLQKFLAMPNVSIGLDPEWQFLTGGYGNRTGNTTGAEVNTVASYLSSFTESHHLPQKLLVLHQFNPEMIVDRSAITNQPGIAVVQHIDGLGQGGNAGKIGDYKVLHATIAGQFSGFKLFFKVDTDLMTPREVLALKPAPDLVTYQ